jgi:hypothetical protein
MPGFSSRFRDPNLRPANEAFDGTITTWSALASQPDPKKTDGERPRNEPADCSPTSHPANTSPMS